jgi:hypothetical protein
VQRDGRNRRATGFFECVSIATTPAHKHTRPRSFRRFQACMTPSDSHQPSMLHVFQRTILTHTCISATQLYMEKHTRCLHTLGGSIVPIFFQTSAEHRPAERGEHAIGTNMASHVRPVRHTTNIYRRGRPAWSYQPRAVSSDGRNAPVLGLAIESCAHGHIL